VLLGQTAQENLGAIFTKTPANLGIRRSAMTCYFRHLEEVFKKAGIEVTSQNRHEIDKIIHDIVGVDYKNCPAAWKQVKNRLAQNETGFVTMLKEAWNNRK
jgi:adenosine deaminase